jgi:hypothetical protein
MKNVNNEILNFDIQVNGDKAIFISKLMSDNNWSKKFTLLAVSEYKKFLCLLNMSSERLSPSKVIDRVWHCHLTFTHSYWHELCRDLLGKEIHHIPSSLSQVCKQQDITSYKKTLAFYQLHFGPPDKKVWGEINAISAEKSKVAAMPTKSYWLSLIFVSTLLTACTITEETSAGEIAIWILGAYVAYQVLKWLVKHSTNGTGGCSSSCGGCGGGD